LTPKRQLTRAHTITRINSVAFTLFDLGKGLGFVVGMLLEFFFVVVPIQGLWRDHWLVRDGQQGMAVITKEHWGGHGVVVYHYRVGQKVYSGQDHRSWQNPKYAHVMAGKNTIVYFSSSHP